MKTEKDGDRETEEKIKAPDQPDSYVSSSRRRSIHTALSRWHPSIKDVAPTNRSGTISATFPGL